MKLRSREILSASTNGLTVAFFCFFEIDYYDVTEVWIKHWWRVPSMAWFRENYCAPGTAGTLCMVPVFGDGAAVNETVWCEEKYQATNCTGKNRM